jgi:hypothetical protein
VSFNTGIDAVFTLQWHVVLLDMLVAAAASLLLSAWAQV